MRGSPMGNVKGGASTSFCSAIVSRLGMLISDGNWAGDAGLSLEIRRGKARDIWGGREGETGRGREGRNGTLCNWAGMD